MKYWTVDIIEVTTTVVACIVRFFLKATHQMEAFERWYDNKIFEMERWARIEDGLLNRLPECPMVPEYFVRIAMSPLTVIRRLKIRCQIRTGWKDVSLHRLIYQTGMDNGITCSVAKKTLKRIGHLQKVIKLDGRYKKEKCLALFFLEALETVPRASLYDVPGCRNIPPWEQGWFRYYVIWPGRPGNRNFPFPIVARRRIG